MWIPDQFFCFPHHCRIGDFRRFINFSYSHRLIFTIIGGVTDADNKMNPQHFGADLANIQIQINPEIRIRIPDHILALAEFAVSECSCCLIIVNIGLL